MVDLNHLQQRVEGSHWVAGIELLEPQVIEENMATVDTQHHQRPTGERSSCRVSERLGEEREREREGGWERERERQIEREKERER